MRIFIPALLRLAVAPKGHSQKCRTQSAERRTKKRVSRSSFRTLRSAFYASMCLFGATAKRRRSAEKKSDAYERRIPC